MTSTSPVHIGEQNFVIAVYADVLPPAINAIFPKLTMINTTIIQHP